MVSISPLRLLFLCAGLLLANVASAQKPTERRPEDWENQVTLTTGWEFVRGDLGGVWETLRSDNRALHLPVWQSITLPHSFNAYGAVDPDVPYYQGPGWYRTQLKIENPFPAGRTLLQFEGASQQTDVWIGQQKVASHLGGYDEFTVDITDAISAYRQSSLARLPRALYRVGKDRIPLAVRCDNSRDLERIPSSLSDFNVDGGLHRPVHLVYLPASGLTRIYATPHRNADGSWRVAIEGRFVTADSVAASAMIRVLDPDGRVVATLTGEVLPTTEKSTLGEIVINAPQLWSPKTPSLYGVEVAVTTAQGSSRAFERFGLRTFEFVEHGPFKLNGERLALHGTHRHEDLAGVASALTDEQMEREMRLMKTMGVNFIRLAHYQQPRRILELCDELGILAWEEIPWCRGGLGGPRYQEQARDMLRAMLDQHHNHPAIILWGLGNENDWPGDFPAFDKKEIRSFMSELNDLAHHADPDRLTAIRRCDFCRDIADVYSPSIWAGWYRAPYTDYRTALRREWEKSPRLFHAEWGGDSHAGRHAENPYSTLGDIQAEGEADERGLDFAPTGGEARASRDGDWSETYLCDLVDWHLKEQETMPWLSGSAMWSFKDFATPLRADDPIPFVNQKGAVERDLTPKESFYLYQSYWTDEPMVHIYGHTWPVRWGKAGEPRWVHVYSNCDEVELFANGVSQGIRKRTTQDFPAAGLRWDVKFEAGMNALRAVGRKQGRAITDEIFFRYETRAWGAPDHFRLQTSSLSPDRVRVQVELLDKAGVVCLDSRARVSFGLTGDGRLIDNQGTVGGSRRVELANGRAQIDVALTQNQTAVLSAHGDHIPTAFITAAQRDPHAQAPNLADVTAEEKARVIRLAELALEKKPVTLRSAGVPEFARSWGVQPGDFFSQADYFWPNPATADGLPYVNRDGESNPQNFDAHRLLLREMRANVAALAAAYRLTGDAKYAVRAAEWLSVFFVDPTTRMNPRLRFAQAVRGGAHGRSWGLIDTLHLAEVALAALALEPCKDVPPETMSGVRKWFFEYTDWLRHDPAGVKEAAAKNNHSVAYWLQVAAFARFTRDASALAEAKQFYEQSLLPYQLAPDGSFPRELARTKPYGYSIFQLDNVVLLTELLSTPIENLWEFHLSDGRSADRAVAFLEPYLANKNLWPYAKDIAHFESWPVRGPALLFAGMRLHDRGAFDAWAKLDADPTDQEVQRNLAMTQPLLWLEIGGKERLE